MDHEETLYSLTNLTGKPATAQRVVTIGTYQFNARLWYIVLASLPLAIPWSLLWLAVLGLPGVFFIPIIPGLAVFLFHNRTTTGLKLPQYRAGWDRIRAKKLANAPYLCGEKLVPEPDSLLWLSSTARPRTTTTAESKAPAAEQATPQMPAPRFSPRPRTAVGRDPRNASLSDSIFRPTEGP